MRLPAGGRLAAIWLIDAVILGSAVGGAAAGPPARAAAKGTIEICKSAANGMTGRSFSFTYRDHTGEAATTTVIGGECSASLSVTAGNIRITEAAGRGTVVQGITVSPTYRQVSQTLGTRTSVVRAPAGLGETVITYTNMPSGAQLKICKQAAITSTQLIGEPFSFSINGGATATVDAGAFGSPNCTGLANYPAGTTVSVQELQPAQNVSVSSIGVTEPPATGIETNLTTRTASLTLGSGVNVVTYTNQVNVVTQTGYVEVCKYGADQYVSGYFSFSIIDSAGLSYGPYSVLVGQCTAPVQVTSGPVTITEAPEFPYALDAVNVYPAENFVSDDLISGTATVNVVAGAVNTETLANFVNDTLLGQVEVCKALDSAESDALAGSTFTFPYTDAAGSGTLSIVANSFEDGPACAFLPTPSNNAGLPLGSGVSITESATPDVALLGVSIAPAVADDGSTTATANLTVQTGIAAATFTNQAEGTIELCKDAADPQTLGDGANPFSFSIDGGALFTVFAGQCSMAITVPAGTASVVESPSTNFHVVSATATGPIGDDRLLSGSNPIMVSVPFGGVGNETLVTYTNAVNAGQFKICKTTSEPAIIGSEVFEFDWSYTVDGTTTTGMVGLTPGECSGLSALIPVVDSAANAVQVSVNEVPTPGLYVDSITYAGNGALIDADTTDATGTFDVGLGVNSITFDNEVLPV